MNLETDLTPFTKINSKWITDLNVKHKTIKLLQDNIGEILDDLGYGDAFLDTTSKTQFIKEIILSCTSLKLKTALQKTMSRE